MDIAAPANRRGVTEVLRHLLESAQDGFFSLRLGVEKLELPQRFGREFCPGPGPKVLGRDLLAGDLAQILIHLGRADGVPIPLIIEVLEQLISRQISAVLDDACETPVVYIGLVVLTVFSAKADVYSAALDRNMSVPQRRQAKALVLLGVLVVSDPKERHIHQPHDGS